MASHSEQRLIDREHTLIRKNDKDETRPDCIDHITLARAPRVRRSGGRADSTGSAGGNRTICDYRGIYPQSGSVIANVIANVICSVNCSSILRDVHGHRVNSNSRADQSRQGRNLADADSVRGPTRRQL
jgi:hypothetical protein